MFAKVLVGVDGLQGGRDAIALARALAPHGELTLANSYPYDPGPSRYLNEGYRRLLEEEAAGVLERERAEVNVSAQIRTIGDTSPARGLHRLAEDLGSDLIVTGSAHRGPVGRVLVGNVSRSTLRGAPCPVAIAPREFAAGALQTIAVGYDESPESALALELADELARETQARLRVVYAVAPPTALATSYAYALDWSEIVSAQLEHAREVVEGVIGKLASDASAEVAQGLPSAELERVSHEVDLMVTGSRGWGPVRRVVMGSTSERLVHSAACPVIVVPRGATEDRQAAGEAATGTSA